VTTTNLGPGRDSGHGPGPERPLERRARALFWISAAFGWVIIGVGLRGVFMHSLDTRPSNLAKFVVGGALLHDLLIAPVLIAVGVVGGGGGRRAGPGARATVQGALVVTAILALFSYPLVRAYGLATQNPTSVPHNYTLNLIIVLGVVWAVAAVLVLRRLRAAT